MIKPDEIKMALPVTRQQREWLKRRAAANGRAVMREAQQIIEAERQKDGGAA